MTGGPIAFHPTQHKAEMAKIKVNGEVEARRNAEEVAKLKAESEAEAQCVRAEGEAEA